VEEELLSDMSEENSDADESIEHLEGARCEAVDTDDNDDDDGDDGDGDEDAEDACHDDDDDDSEWEDVDDECVTDSDDCDIEPADCIQSSAADNKCDMVCNCPDILTGPQLIKLLRSLCHKANSRADVHTVGLVCMFLVHLDKQNSLTAATLLEDNFHCVIYLPTACRYLMLLHVVHYCQDVM